jgi:glycosyltransferase 2 family protein
VSSVASRDWRSTSRTMLRFLPSILITILAFWLLSRIINWGDFFVTLRSVPIWVLLLTVALYLVTLLLRALCWQFLLQRKVPAGQVFLALNEGYFFNNILPFRIGELARAFLLGRRSHLGTFYVLPTIVVERSYDLAIAAGLLLATLPLALVAVLLLLGIVLGLFALYLAARYREWVEARIERLAGRWSIIRRFVLPQLHAILGGFSVLTRWQYFAGSLTLLASSWFLSILRDWVLIRVFVPEAPLWWAALGISAANMMGAIPSVMASLGTFELGATSALGLVGVPGEAALAYALIVHVTHLVFSSLIGAFALSREGQTISELYADIRRAK